MFGWKPQGAAKRHDMTERSGANAGSTSFAGNGLIAGTRVASNLGWRPVEALMAGDKVLTFDHGMQTVVEVRRTKLWSCATQVPAHMAPLVIPENVLGNRVEIRVLPEQGVMVESEAASDALGDPFAVVAASGLEGFRGIYRDTCPREVEVITLFFAQPQVIYAEGGLLVYCPQAHLALSDMIEPSTHNYEILDEAETEFLVECMQYEDQTSQFRSATHIANAMAA